MRKFSRFWRNICGLALGALAALASPLAAKPVTDCPLRDAPFSAGSPLIDLMLSPAAKAVVERHLPQLAKGLPPAMFGTTPPTFGSIITVSELMGMAGRADAGLPDKLAALDLDLRKLPVTPADRVARCARYDNDVVQLAIADGKPPKGQPSLLLFEKINGFKDTPSVNAAHAAFLAMAERLGWVVVVSDKGGAMTPANLRQFDAVIWNNISGDVLTLAQRRAFKAYVEGGGAFVGVHGTAGDPVYFWDWFVDGLLGARFAGHPFPNQFQNARVVVDDASHPIAAGLPHEWVMKEEWYSFKNNPRARGSRIIATLDESSYVPEFMGKVNLRMGDHPIAWTRCVGRGRMFYSAIGHRPEMYTEPVYVRMLEQGIGWATGAAAKADCRKSG